MRPLDPSVPATRAATLALVLSALLVPVVGAATPSSAAAQAPSPRERLLVDVEWLAPRLEDPSLVLLHVGPREGFGQERIPGARYIALSDISAPEDHAGGERLSLELPDAGSLVRMLEGLGISDDSRIVVYFAADWVTPAARVVLTLDWIGLGERTSLLDGGLSAWKGGGGAVVGDAVAGGVPGRAPGAGAGPAPAAARRPLTSRPRADLVVTADWVRDRLEAEGYRIIDARAPVHYDGIQATQLHRRPVRRGHIPGAANLPYSDIVDAELRIRPASELRSLFEAAGVRPGDTIVGYCHLGQFATLVLFGARTLGHPVRLYDGSFQDWGSRPELPVEGPRP